MFLGTIGADSLLYIYEGIANDLVLTVERSGIEVVVAGRCLKCLKRYQ